MPPPRRDFLPRFRHIRFDYFALDAALDDFRAAFFLEPLFHIFAAMAPFLMMPPLPRYMMLTRAAPLMPLPPPD